MKGAISHFSPYVFTALSHLLSPKIITAFCAEAFTTFQQKFRLKSENLNPHIFCCICTELKWFIFNMLCEHNGLTPPNILSICQNFKSCLVTGTGVQASSKACCCQDFTNGDGLYKVKQYRSLPVVPYMPNEGNQLVHWIEG